MGDFKQDLLIDKYSLDSECTDQARRFQLWGEDYANAMAERDRADQKLEVIKAEVEQDIRRTPERYGLDKVTEASIKSAVILDQRVQDATEEWIKAKHQVGILMSARDAFDQRRAMIENLVKLFLSGYWADPKVPKEAKAGFEDEAFNAQVNALNKNKLVKRKK